MAALSIQLFGRFRVRHQYRELGGFESRRVQELFSFLLLHRDRPQPREVLAEELWPQTTTHQARANLRKTICRLQATLSNVEPSVMPMLLVDADTVAVHPRANIWIDVAALDDAATLVRGQAGELLPSFSVAVVSAAVDVYGGDLLEGWYTNWCVFERERLQNAYLALLDKLMAYHEQHHEYELALVRGEQLLRCDRAREETHRRIMRLYNRTGNRSAALRQYQHCATALAEDLGVQPSRLTERLVQCIRAGEDDHVPADRLMRDEQAPENERAAVLSYLEQAQQLLNEAQRLFLAGSVGL